MGTAAEHLTRPNRHGTDPYSWWCGRESPRGPPYPDLQSTHAQYRNFPTVESLQYNILWFESAKNIRPA